MTSSLTDYMSGAIDYAEYIRRRYAEETDAMVVSLNRFNRDNSADGVADPDIRDDGRVK